MTYEEVFDKTRDDLMRADVSDIREHLAFQFNIVGEGEGAFYVEIRDGRLYVDPYEYYARDALFICRADTLFKIAAGELDPSFAYTIGKIKIRGDVGKALRLKQLAYPGRKLR